VTALDIYLTNRLDEGGLRRPVTIADRFVDTLFDVGYSRATLRALKRGLRS
jgi:hypothetical protein